MQPDGVKSPMCDNLRGSLRAGRSLTPAELAHAEACEACADALMEAEVEAALAVKPQVEVPEDFAAKLALRLPPERNGGRWALGRRAYGWLGEHPGRNAAVALLLVVMAVVTMSNPGWLAGTAPVRMTLMLVLMGEVAAIALWLGLRREA